MEPATPPILFIAMLLLAPADAKEEARVLAKQATVAYNLGNYDEAASRYEAAYRLVQDPALLYNIGQSYRLADRPEKALVAYKGFLRTTTRDDPNRAGAETRITELERAVAERKTVPSPPVPVEPPPDDPPPVEPFPPDPAAAPRPSEPAVTSGPPSASAPAVSAAPASQPHAPDAEVADVPPPRFHTSAGGELGWGGRSGREQNAVDYHLFGRLRDRGARIYEVGYLRRPLYPMNPRYQFAAVYGVFQAARRWVIEAGALGAQGELLLGVGGRGEYFDLHARLERIEPDELCGPSGGSLVYFVPEARLKVPVSSRFKVSGLASYRGKLSVSECNFRPSLVTLDLSAELALPRGWVAMAGVGHYGLFDYGSGNPDSEWPSRASAAEHVHFGGRYLMGRVAFYGRYRFITYADGSHELGLGVEFRSSPEAP